MKQKGITISKSEIATNQLLKQFIVTHDAPSEGMTIEEWIERAGKRRCEDDVTRMS